MKLIYLLIFALFSYSALACSNHYSKFQDPKVAQKINGRTGGIQNNQGKEFFKHIYGEFKNERMAFQNKSFSKLTGGLHTQQGLINIVKKPIFPHSLKNSKGNIYANPYRHTLKNGVQVVFLPEEVFHSHTIRKMEKKIIRDVSPTYLKIETYGSNNIKKIRIPASISFDDIKRVSENIAYEENTVIYVRKTNKNNVFKIKLTDKLSKGDFIDLVKQEITNRKLNINFMMTMVESERVFYSKVLFPEYMEPEEIYKASRLIVSQNQNKISQSQRSGIYTIEGVYKPLGKPEITMLVFVDYQGKILNSYPKLTLYGDSGITPELERILLEQ